MNEIYSYIDQHSSREPEVLSELVRQTYLRVTNPRMISGNVQGRLLAMLIEMSGAKRVLEIGTFTGYATISMALAMEPLEGKLITIEVDDELYGIASEFIERAGVGRVVEQRVGDALRVIETLSGEFDMVFIDADKREYCNYYEMLFARGLVRSGSIIVADNTLWDGKVLHEIRRGDSQTAGIVEFNTMVATDGRVERVMLPLRDGLTLIRVK